MLSLNLGLLGLLIYVYLSSNERRESSQIVYNVSDSDTKPYLIFNKDSVDVSFIDPTLEESLNPDETSYLQRMKKIRSCRPYLREFVEKGVNYHPDIASDFPSFVPVFKEKPNAINYEWDAKYRTTVKTDWPEYNPLKIIGFYDDQVGEEHYNANPDVPKDFDMPHMGLFNDRNYCDAHDLFVLQSPEFVMKKMYFLSDYHQLSIPRMSALSKLGKDTNPQVSKNMKPINFFQRLYAIDIRTSIFYFKLATFHHYHELGRHFGCWGQSYNHIPGHGHLIRKDFLVTSANSYIKKYSTVNESQCFSEGTYFPVSFRLYDEEECKAYFQFIKTEAHKKETKISEVQFVLKVGFGVHRGAGVYLVDTPTENKLIANYSDGALCGKIHDNLVTQKYIYDVKVIDEKENLGGYKFDFRIYMMVVSVDPLIIYYHDGFLRVSLFRYNLKNLDIRSHLTNTELAKEIFKQVDDGNTHEGMNSVQLRDFQMRTFEAFEEYLIKTNKTKYTGFLKNTLKPEIKRAYLHLGKMFEDKVQKNSKYFEIFGVDFVMGSDDKIYIVEVNPSPMMVGTSPKKTELMKSVNKGIVQISLAYLRSRFKRTHEYLKKNMVEIMAKENLAKHKAEFKRLNRNYLEPEFEGMMKDVSWEMVFDQTKCDMKKYGEGLITPHCANVMDKLSGVPSCEKF